MKRNVNCGCGTALNAPSSSTSNSLWAWAWTGLVLGIVLLLPYTAAHATLSLRVVADRAPIGATIEAYVTVTDANDDPVSGLLTSNFSVFEDGSAQAIEPLVLPPITGSTAVTLVFVMDYSNSVISYKAAIEAAVSDIVNNHMLADDVGAIIKFNTAVSLVTPPGFTANKTDLDAAIASSYPTVTNGTALYDAVMLGLNGLEQNDSSLPAGPKALILLSDGRETKLSTATLNDVLAKIKSTSIPIFTIAFGNVINTTVLQSLADTSHGQNYPAANSAALQGIYQTIADKLQNEYLLSYSSAITDCNVHTLQVQADSPSVQSSTVTFQRCTPSAGGGGAAGPIDCLILIGFGAVSRYRRRRAGRH